MYCLTVPATALHHQNSASDWLFFQKRSSKYLHGKYRKKKKKVYLHGTVGRAILAEGINLYRKKACNKRT